MAEEVMLQTGGWERPRRWGHRHTFAFSTWDLVRLRFRAAAYRYELQRFAAEDEGRTELPTDRRKREEREKGNVPRSSDLVAAGVLLGTVMTLFLAGAYVYEQCRIIFDRYLNMDFGQLTRFEIQDAKRLIFMLFLDAAKIVAPIAAAGIVMAVVGNVSQVGALFTLRAIEFKPERLIPDFTRVLPARRTLYNLLKILVQIAVIGFAAYTVIMGDFIPMLKASGMGLTQAVGLFAWVSFKLLIICGILLLLLAVPDYFYQRFEFIESLKMTVAELRRETKEDTGDPLIRQRIRERAMSLRRQQSMLKEVPKADVVITNPTHFAVALRYDQASAQAPLVIAKGVDHVAFLIRTVARENNIPIEHNPPLARTLYKEVEIGQPIPENMYRVVSLIFAKLSRFQRTGPA